MRVDVNTVTARSNHFEVRLFSSLNLSRLPGSNRLASKTPHSARLDASQFLGLLYFLTPTRFAVAEQLGGDDTDTKKHRYRAIETICRKLDASFSNLGSSCFCCASATAGTTPACNWCANSSGWHRCLRNVGEPMTSSFRAEHLSGHSRWFWLFVATQLRGCALICA